MDRIHTDVCIVGAGYSGLAAARRRTQAGSAVVVLEAVALGSRLVTETLRVR
jgi:flavin-dependent dehydrogenase